ncbi:hypothetical protein ACJVDH_19575 [Pedobacter sp. AW1-32]|uniref:hypothetical protein n=1 Tax=Pedobacter sp. AW1-32 TaxID=3383026 RepID=UPI003FF01664
MQKTFSFFSVFFVVILFFFSCKQNKPDVVLTESLIRETEGIAIGKAKFGISEKQFNGLYPDSLIKLDGNSYILTGNYNIVQELNMINLIDSATINNTAFDQTLFDRMDLLKDHFAKTYGLPQHDMGYPEQTMMSDGKFVKTYIWIIGKKEISVGIALENTARGNVYYVLGFVEKRS